MPRKIPKSRFSEVLNSVRSYARSVGLSIVDTSDLDPYFKGDLDGVSIWIASALDDEEELFNVIHLIGHTVQWNVCKNLRALGSILHTNPDDKTLRQLQEYEWESNCYGLWILHRKGIFDLDQWLFEKYREDMYYLTNYYKTGEKLREITDFAKANEFAWPLVPKPIPKFFPYANKETRKGIVIEFNRANVKPLPKNFLETHIQTYHDKGIRSKRATNF